MISFCSVARSLPYDVDVRTKFWQWEAIQCVVFRGLQWDQKENQPTSSSCNSCNLHSLKCFIIIYSTVQHPEITDKLQQADTTSLYLFLFIYFFYLMYKATEVHSLLVGFCDFDPGITAWIGKIWDLGWRHETDIWRNKKNVCFWTHSCKYKIPRQQCLNM